MTPWEEWSAMLFGQHPTYDMSSAVLLGVHRPASMSVNLPLEEAVADAAKDAEEHFREKITWAREHMPSAALDYVPIRMIPPWAPRPCEGKARKRVCDDLGEARLSTLHAGDDRALRRSDRCCPVQNCLGVSDGVADQNSLGR